MEEGVRGLRGLHGLCGMGTGGKMFVLFVVCHRQKEGGPRIKGINANVGP
jgi:hypothetical protein